MTTEPIICASDATVAEALALIRKQQVAPAKASLHPADRRCDDRVVRVEPRHARAERGLEQRAVRRLMIHLRELARQPRYQPHGIVFVHVVQQDREFLAADTGGAGPPQPWAIGYLAKISATRFSAFSVR